MTKIHSYKWKQFLFEQKTLVFLIILILVMGIFSPYFLTKDNLLNILVQSSIYGIMACGMSFAIISGDFDLSVGSTMALSGLLAILLEPWIGQTSAIIFALLAAAAMGLLNGYLVAKCHISAFIVTIGTSYIFKGIALKISGGNPIASTNSWFVGIGNGSVLGIPYLVIIMVVLVLITHYVLSVTRFGRNVYTIGGNMEVSANSGIQTGFYKASVFVICAVTAGAAGILNAARLNTASAVQGDNAALSVITGVVIGGTSLIGGVGSISRSIIGIFIFSVITNALDLMGVFSYYQTAIRGILLIFIIGMEAYGRHSKNR